jgi:BolA protein
MSSNPDMAAQIETRLRKAFVVAGLVVEDESAQHHGHAGWREEGETHFHVALESPDFTGLSRLARHRAVHGALGDLIPRIHALRLTLGCPD